MNVAIPAVAPPAVTATPVSVPVGLAQIVPLRIVLDGSVAEPREIAAGFEIGAGGVMNARGTPAAPLDPIVMPMPMVTPADGALIEPSTLTAAPNGDPYTLAVQAAASGAANVRLVLNQPYGTYEGSGLARLTVTAADLLSGVNGVAWTEYPGESARGDRSIQLGDGRTRWLVTTAEDRLQIYEPSPQVRFAYRIDLGPPVIVRAGGENASGASLDFTYEDYSAIQKGTTGLRIDFPESVRIVFGRSWPTASVGFGWTFGPTAGPFSGDLSPFFTAASLPLWADSVAVVAHPVVPPGAVADDANWQFSRVKSDLGVPQLTSATDSSGFYSPGKIEFAVPVAADGTRIGRLSFDRGADLSTGTTLSIDVAP